MVDSTQISKIYSTSKLQPSFSFAAEFEKIPTKDHPVLNGIDLSPKSKANFLPEATSGTKASGFLKRSHNSVKLKSALEQEGNLYLFEESLLRPENGRKHSKEMTDRFFRKVANIDKCESNKLKKHQLMNGRAYRRGEPRIKFWGKQKCFQFLTILHEVVQLDNVAAINSVLKLKHHLNEFFSQLEGVGCLGVFEVEVTNTKLMRDICERKKLVSAAVGDERAKQVDSTNENEVFRKLTNLELMAKDLKKSLYQNEKSELLVHFHGVIYVPSEAKLAEIRSALEKQTLWNKYPRQILMKELTKKYGNVEKSVEKNLSDLAAYMTKGGNDWIGKRPYLRYKIKFGEGMPLSDDEIANQSLRTNDLLGGENKSEKKNIDLLSLSVEEINVLSLTIDNMMKMSSKNKGYQFVHGRW